MYKYTRLGSTEHTKPMTYETFSEISATSKCMKLIRDGESGASFEIWRSEEDFH